MNVLRFCLNGQWITEQGLSPTTTLLRYLRDRRGLSGTKEGCAEGDCGACTVAVVEKSPEGTPTFRAVNSCLLLLPMLQGKHVFTVEALKDVSSGAHHPAQVAMADALGSQCGYCTPGIVMSLFEATYRSDMADGWKLDDQLCGNLCRCTGYRPIREAALQVAGLCPKDRFASALDKAAPLAMTLSYEGEGQTYLTPSDWDTLWKHLAAHPDARLVAGGTDLSLDITKRFQKPPKLISLEGLSDLKRLEERPESFVLGAGATLSELEDFAQTRLPSVARMVRYFGARQIKHRGTVGGNLCNASPIGDLAPVLLSLSAVAVIRAAGRERRVPLDAFFVGYRKTALLPGEILASVEVPKPAPNARALAYKVSKRRELDISTVAAGFCVTVDDAGLVSSARLAFGGMAATPKRATLAESALVGKRWSEESVLAAAATLTSEFFPVSDHRGSKEYRARVAHNLLHGFYLEAAQSSSPAPGLRPLHAGTVQPTGVEHG